MSLAPIEMITAVDSEKYFNEALFTAIRPSHLPLRAPAQISHLVMLHRNNSADREHLIDLCRHFQGIEPPGDVQSWHVNLGKFRLYWKRQAEFSSYTFYREEASPIPFSDPVINWVPHGWIEGLRGDILVTTHLEIESRDNRHSAENLHALFAADATSACKVADGAAVVWSDFRPYPNRSNHFLICDINLSDQQIPVLIQHLLEVEAYMKMALLSRPVIQEYAPRVSRLEQSLTNLTIRMARFQRPAEKQLTRDQLSLLTKEIRRINSATLFRFGTSKAYYALLQLRILNLQEQPIEGHQSLQVLMKPLLCQVMCSCQSLPERLRQLSLRVSHVTAVLDMRIDSSHR